MEENESDSPRSEQKVLKLSKIPEKIFINRDYSYEIKKMKQILSNDGSLDTV